MKPPLNQSPYKYTEWINIAILEVIKKAIVTLAKNGLYQDTYFYLSFNTTHPLVKIPLYLKQQYKESMTIVLQNQFYNVITDNKGFSIDLLFSGKPETLYIPWNSITNLLDPVTPISLKVEFLTKTNSKLEEPSTQNHTISNQATTPLESVAKNLKDTTDSTESSVTAKESNNKIIKFPKKS